MSVACSVYTKPESTLLNGVRPYCSQDFESVAAIALAHIPRLTSPPKPTTSEGCKQRFHRDIKPFLDSMVSDKENPFLFTYVCVEKGQPIGFITCDVKDHPAGPEAAICHLAIDSNHAHQGHGTQLMEYVLDDFKKRSIKDTELWTSSPQQELHEFYGKFGYRLIERTFAGACRYRLSMSRYSLLKAAKQDKKIHAFFERTIILD